MDKLTITIDTSGATFGETESERNMEVIAILYRFVTEVHNLDDEVTLRDTNGNPVGYATWTDS